MDVPMLEQVCHAGRRSGLYLHSHQVQPPAALHQVVLVLPPLRVEPAAPRRKGRHVSPRASTQLRGRRHPDERCRVCSSRGLQ